MDRVLHRATQAGHVHSSIGPLTLRSIAHDQNHDRMAAVADLNAGLELGRVGGYRRVFLDEGPTIVPLLRQRGPHGVSLANVLAPPGEVAVRRLSSREQEVLRLLDRGLSNREIAEQLVVTRDTIKTHLRNIGTKLAASTRTQVLARARAAGLLD